MHLLTLYSQQTIECAYITVFLIISCYRSLSDASPRLWNALSSTLWHTGASFACFSLYSLICLASVTRPWHLVTFLFFCAFTNPLQVCMYIVSAVMCYMQVKLSQFTWLLMPVNLGGIHWALLSAHVPSCSVCVVDTLSMPSGPTYLAKWKYVYNVRTFFSLCLAYTLDTVIILTALEARPVNRFHWNMAGIGTTLVVQHAPRCPLPCLFLSCCVLNTSLWLIHVSTSATHETTDAYMNQS